MVKSKVTGPRFRVGFILSSKEASPFSTFYRWSLTTEQEGHGQSYEEGTLNKGNTQKDT